MVRICKGGISVVRGESESERNIIGEVINDFGKEMFVKVE